MNPFKEIIANETNKNLEKGKLADVIKGADVVIGLIYLTQFQKKISKQ